MKFNIEWREDIILKQTNKQTNKQSNRDFETLSLAKNRDSETPSYKKRDCETHITAKKTRLRDPWISTKILRDPEVLKDHIRHPCFSSFRVVYIIIYAGKSVITKDIIIFHYQDHHPITMFSVKRQLRKKKKQITKGNTDAVNSIERAVSRHSR